MSLVIKDRVKETTTVVSTGTATLLGASTGFQAFSAIGNSNTTWYAIVGRGTGEWEVGVGTYTLSGTTLSRDTVLSSSNSGNLVNFSAGTKDVFITQPAEKPYLQLDQTVPQTLTGGRPVSNEGMQFGLTPATPIDTEGQLTWASDYHTMTLRSLPESNLRVGQDEWRYVYNNTGAEIAIGSAVYITGVGGTSPKVVTIALAKADFVNTLDIVGLAVMDIAINGYGMVSIRGQFNNINTSNIIGATTGALTFLSDIVAGDLTTVIPTLPSLECATGRIVVLSTTATVTISNGSPAVIGWASHGFTIGDRVEFTSTITLPTGISVNNHYYVMTAGYGANSFRIELVKGSGTAVNTSSAGSGVFTGYKFNGVLNIHIVPAYSLTQLTDVTIGTPVLDQVLRYNGAEWANGNPTSSSASVGISFFMDDTNIIPIVVGTNTLQVNTLSKTPVTIGAVVDQVVVTSATSPVAGEAYLYNTALSRTALDGGVWTFNTYCAVSSVTGISSLARSVFNVIVSAGTVTTTALGVGTRTATTTVDVFVAGDVGATRDKASYLQTPKGLYEISAVATARSATIIVPTAYPNEAGVATSKWKYLFQATTGEISATTPNYALYTSIVAEANIPILVTDKLGEIVFAFTNTAAAKTVYYTHNGATNYSQFTTPLITLHNNLAGLQGGTSSEAYHLTSADYVGTGTGLVVRSAGPTLSAPVLGTPASGNLSNCTFPIDIAVHTVTVGLGGGSVAGNTAVGHQALLANTTGTYNVAVGFNALVANTIGIGNTGVGYGVLGVNTTGAYNTALGVSALLANTTGMYNTALGASALIANTTGAYNVAVGSNALAANTIGIGNTALGLNALGVNTTGVYNTALGTSALLANTTGMYNVAVGTTSLYNNVTGINNTAIGYQALYTNTEDSNTAVGATALKANTTGTYNVAVGHTALLANTIGIANTGIGYGVLVTNTAGAYNTALGLNAMNVNTTGAYNTALGVSTLIANTSGIRNTAVGTSALSINTLGGSNTGVGYGALSLNITGSNNTCIGSNAVNATATSNQIQLGDSATRVWCYGAVQDRSDRRDKAEIRDTVLGLEFISKLRPVDFKWDMREDYRTPMPVLSANSTIEEKAAHDGLKGEWLQSVRFDHLEHDGSKIRNRYHHGIIAQDVQAIIQETGIDFGGLIDCKVEGGDDVLSMGYTEFIAPLIKAVQELKAEIEALKKGHPL